MQYTQDKAMSDRTPEPDIQTLEEWDLMGMSETPCGCIVEIDGRCEHGEDSWFVILGLV